MKTKPLAIESVLKCLNIISTMESSRPPPVKRSRFMSDFQMYVLETDYFLLIINRKGIHLIMNKTVKTILTIIKYLCTALLGYGASTL